MLAILALVLVIAIGAGAAIANRVTRHDYGQPDEPDSPELLEFSRRYRERNGSPRGS